MGHVSQLAVRISFPSRPLWHLDILHQVGRKRVGRDGVAESEHFRRKETKGTDSESLLTSCDQ